MSEDLWSAIEAIGTVIAAVAALIAVVQTSRAQRSRHRIERADLLCHVNSVDPSKQIDDNAAIPVRLTNRTASPLAMIAVIVRPRWILKDSLVDERDWREIREFRAIDPYQLFYLMYEVEVAPGGDRDVEFQLTGAWELGWTPGYKKERIADERIRPFINGFSTSCCYQDILGQTWIRTSRGSIKRIRESSMLLTVPMSRLAP